MTSPAFAAAMRAAFGDRARENCPLGPFTTFRVGGPADWLLDVRTSDELATALALAAREGIPVTMLGGGSNVLVADAGVRGLVIRPRGGDIRRTGAGTCPRRRGGDDQRPRPLDDQPRCAGLEAWAGTPGTVGGAVFGNAHFAGRLIGDLVTRVRLVSRAGVALEAAARGAGVRLRWQPAATDRRDPALGGVRRSADGDPASLRKIARESLAFRKRTQPLDTPSAGCIFRNPQPGRDAVPEGIPWSAGALVDRAGLKGAAVGGARVSPTHGNFIVNEGQATARDIRELIGRCRARVREQFGVELHEEIVYLGDFD